MRIALAALFLASLAGCGGPESRIASWCRASANDSASCDCLEGELRDNLSDADLQALAFAPLDATGLPVGLTPAAAVAFSESTALCEVRFEGPVSAAR